MSLLGDGAVPREPLARMLRPIYRATPNIVIDPTTGRSAVAAYRSGPGTRSRCSGFPRPPRPTEARLVDDARLRDALRALREDSDSAGARSYALPVAGVGRIAFPVPNVVDDASYAIECAAVGEVDLVRLDRQIRELEARITELEAEFWPRVRSALRRLARRRR